MKKLLAVGDVHGTSYWKQIVKNAKKDTIIVFIGDYFDSFDIGGDEQIANFKEILAFKKKNPERVILLIGNHEVHYISSLNQRYSGYQLGKAREIGQLLAPLIRRGTLVACYQNNRFLFTHAGVSKTWFKTVGIDENDKRPLSSIINDLFHENTEAFGFNSIDRTGYGDSVYQGPLWIRPEPLLSDAIKGYVQVVGHTHVDKINCEKDVIFIDTMGRSREYLEITTSGNPVIKTYENICR